jgi:hypothetical protein
MTQAAMRAKIARRGFSTSLRRALAIALFAALMAPWAQVRANGHVSPFARDFAAHEAAGLRFGQIHIRAEDIFDTSDPNENYALFRLANRLHVQTRPRVIERALLFKRGDPVSVRVIEETERILRSTRHLYDVQLRPLEVHDGEVDVEVVTRDTWSLEFGTSVARAGGANTAGIRVAEYNLLGTGAALTLARSTSVDRASTALAYADNRVFGTRTRLGLAHATNSDGSRSVVEVVRPFYALDARWAAGFTGVKDNRIDAVYAGGKISSQYRQRQASGEAFAGWSTGLRDGWVQRVSAGVQQQDDAFTAQPGLTAPPVLPPSRRLRAPFVRWDVIEDRVARETNRNLMGRPEFFPLGWLSTVQIGHTLRALGSTQDAWLYGLSVQRGFEPGEDQTLLLSSQLSGQFFDGDERRQRMGVDVRWFVPQGPRRLFYAAGTVQWLNRPDPADALRLGGEDGLRGYPLRYQNGTRRALITIEQRYYTDVYLWRLFRLGGAAFFDVGRAWGGELTNTTNPGWLSNVGAGVRIVNTRSAFGNVLHIDLAVPLNASGDVKRVQLLVKTKTTF